MEQRIAAALDAAGLEYRTDFEGAVPEHLDFYLPTFGVFIEVKGGHSFRISNQMTRAANVVVLQGEKSVELFADLIRKLSKPIPPKPAWDLQKHLEFIGRLRRHEPTTEEEWELEYAWMQSQQCLKQPGE